MWSHHGLHDLTRCVALLEHICVAQAALEEGERLDLEQEQADERKEVSSASRCLLFESEHSLTSAPRVRANAQRHDRGSFTASTYTAGSTLGTSRSIKTGRSMA